MKKILLVLFTLSTMAFAETKTTREAPLPVPEVSMTRNDDGYVHKEVELGWVYRAGHISLENYKKLQKAKVGDRVTLGNNLDATYTFVKTK